MSEVLTFPVSWESNAKFTRLCEVTQQSKSIVLRQVLHVVSVEQLQQASQGESGDESLVVTGGD